MKHDVESEVERWPIMVSCDRRGDGYRCRVQIGDDPGATHHEVAFERSEMEQLAPEGTKPEEFVRAAFLYLIEREPREQILRDFELPVIGRYFPGWQDAVRERLR
jgi:hypothetical protein